MKKTLLIAAVALIVVSIIMGNGSTSDTIAGIGVILLIVSAIMWIVGKLKKKPKPSAPQPVEPQTVQAPAPVEAEPTPTRAPRSRTAGGVHQIERFHKLETSAFTRKARKNGFVVFDLETTGLRQYDKIIEIAAIKYDSSFQEIDAFQTLVNPEKAIPAEATRIHGISDEMVAYSPKVVDVLPEFFSFVQGYPMIGYNAESFDVRYLNAAVNKAGMNCAVEYADALPWARRHYKLDSYKLGDVASHVGIDVTGWHRAMADCRMLGAIVKDMMG